MTEQHSSKPTSWATVGVLILAFVIGGFALPLQSVALGVVAAIVLVVGLVMGVAFGIMEDFH